MKRLTLEKTLLLMETRLKVWNKQKESSNDVDVCLIASICEAKDDIKTVKRAIRLQDNYSKQFGDIFNN